MVLTFLNNMLSDIFLLAPPPVHPTRDIQWGWLALRVKAHYRKIPTKLSCSLLFSYIWETYAAIGNSYDCVVWTYLVFYPKSQTMFNATRKCWFLSLAHSCLPLSTTVCLCTSPSIQLTQAWPIPSTSLIQFTNNVPLTPTLKYQFTCTLEAVLVRLRHTLSLLL